MEKIGAGQKILIIDDEENIVDLLSNILTHSGFVVIGAFNGESGIEKAIKEKPHIIILDIMMPGMDGFEVLKRLKEDEQTSDIPVIMLTAKTEDSAVIESWRKGAEFYIPKPFEIEELLHVINLILKSKYAETN
ncbi:MAG: response regulator transcription factor [bacterium]